MKSIRVRTAATAAAALVMALLAAAAQAQIYSVLYKFQGNPDGCNPSAGVIRDAMGNLYGTTSAGGASNVGTVFKLGKTGETVLYSFCPGGYPCTDGAIPNAGLIQDAMGNLYGITGWGGTAPCSCGVVFKIDPNGKETVLYSFAGGTDGENPSGGLIQDASGNFYGTTTIGGGSGCRNGYGCGTVFELDTNGKETVLYSFTGFGRHPDGQYPNGVVRDATGNFYGTTGLGGVYNKGTVFKLSNTGVETVVRSFKARTDGNGPGRLIQDAKGNLYGTTFSGGSTRCGGVGCGVVFKLSNTGKLTVLHSMKGGADGKNSYGGVVRDAQGNLYGTTEYGGDLSCGQGQGCGVVFKLTP